MINLESVGTVSGARDFKFIAAIMKRLGDSLAKLGHHSSLTARPCERYREARHGIYAEQSNGGDVKGNVSLC